MKEIFFSVVVVEVVDALNRRCPLDNRMIEFTTDGPVEWRGGIAQGPDNYILSKSIPVECGINRVLVRSTTKAGKIKITAKTDGLPKASVSMETVPVKVTNGLSDYNPSATLAGHLEKGPTPEKPSYKERKFDVPVVDVEAGSAQENVKNTYDDNENSLWISDGILGNSWITFNLERSAIINDITAKLSGWRKRSYPIEVYAGDKLIWKGYTPKGLGYIHIIPENPVKTNTITIRQVGAATEKDAFSIQELAGGPANEMDTKKSKRFQLGIVEIEFQTLYK